MIDVNVLRGSHVRRGETKGHITLVSLPWVRMEWQEDEGSRSEAMLRSDPRLAEEIEILTTDRGWVSLATVLGVVKENKVENYEAITGLIEEVRDILDLHEAPKMSKADKKIMGKFKGKTTKHNPFRWLKKGKGLGPGPRGSTAVPGKKRGRFSCRCSSYKCLCKDAEGGIKRVRIKKAWKGTYNIAYRKWRKKHGSKYAPGKSGRFRKRVKGK